MACTIRYSHRPKGSRNALNFRTHSLSTEGEQYRHCQSSKSAFKFVSRNNALICQIDIDGYFVQRYLETFKGNYPKDVRFIACTFSGILDGTKWVHYLLY